jgi:maleate cis-trans isomerase
MLNKNAQERPSVAQILQMPIVRQKMIDFVNNGGITIAGSKGLYIKNNPQVLVQQ